MNTTSTGPARWASALSAVLALARVAWLAVAALTVSLYVASVWAGLRELEGPCPPNACQHGKVPLATGHAFADLHLPVGFLGGYLFGLNLVFTLGFAAIGVLIFWRRSRDVLALYISLTLLVFGAASFQRNMLPLRFANPAWQMLVSVLGFLGTAGFGAFLYICPDGRFVPRWTKLAAAGWALWMLPIYFAPNSPFAFINFEAGPALGVWALFLGSFVYAQVYRYRRVSSPVQRVQTKWIVLGIAAAAAGHFGGMFLLSFQPPTPTSPLGVLADLAGDTLLYVSMLLVPLCIGIAILRHRLFDVDLVIRLSVIYSTLVVTLALLYEFGTLTLMKALLAITHEPGLGVEVAVAFGVGALARPLHTRIDRIVTRALHPRKYAAEKRIEAFGKQVRRELEVMAVTERLEEAAEIRLERLRLRRAAGGDRKRGEADQRVGPTQRMNAARPALRVEDAPHWVPPHHPLPPTR